MRQVFLYKQYGYTIFLDLIELHNERLDKKHNARKVYK